MNIHPSQKKKKKKKKKNALLALAFLACGGLHIVLRLLSLHLCNEYPSLPTKKKTKKLLCLNVAEGPRECSCAEVRVSKGDADDVVSQDLPTAANGLS